eukprot:12012808-Karenia_brevis.AAC.1
MKVLLAVEHTGTGVTSVTVWSDSKILVDGFQKEKATPQPGMCTDWEDVWDRVDDALAERNVSVQVRKVKAHTSDQNIASYEQQAGNWLADHFADQGAYECQLKESEMRPILEKDQGS